MVPTICDFACVVLSGVLWHALTAKRRAPRKCNTPEKADSRNGRLPGFSGVLSFRVFCSRLIWGRSFCSHLIWGSPKIPERVLSYAKWLPDVHLSYRHPQAMCRQWCPDHGASWFASRPGRQGTELNPWFSKFAYELRCHCLWLKRT